MTSFNFQKLTIADKKIIEDFVEQFPPYSDFNFISLLTYDTQETTEYCIQGGNLYIKFEDYDTNENFFSVMGKENVQECIMDLLDYSVSRGLPAELHLIPEIVIDLLSPEAKQSLDITEDRDNFDYIVSAKDVAELDENSFPRKHKLIEKFNQEYPNVYYEVIDLSDSDSRDSILKTFELWRELNGKTEEETQTELIAVQRLLDNHSELPTLHAIGVYDGDALIAFNTFDVASAEFGVSSFQKANKTYEGIYAYLTTSAAKELVRLGVTYINYEQDLGIEGLRSSKLSWHPVMFLKKYSVSLKA